MRRTRDRGSEVSGVGWDGYCYRGNRVLSLFLNCGCPTSYCMPLRVPSKEIRVTTNGPESPYDFYHGFSWGESNPWMALSLFYVERDVERERDV